MARDREENKIFIGSWVRWFDPQEEYRDLSRIYEVYDIVGDEDDQIVCIADEYGEAEVLPSELLVVQ